MQTKNIKNNFLTFVFYERFKKTFILLFKIIWRLIHFSLSYVVFIRCQKLLTIKNCDLNRKTIIILLNFQLKKMYKINVD